MKDKSPEEVTIFFKNIKILLENPTIKVIDIKKQKTLVNKSEWKMLYPDFLKKSNKNWIIYFNGPKQFMEKKILEFLETSKEMQKPFLFVLKDIICDKIKSNKYNHLDDLWDTFAAKILIMFRTYVESILYYDIFK